MKFTPVFSQISYKPQTLAESSNRFITLDKPIKKYIQGQQNKRTCLLSEFLKQKEARKVLKKANMPQALSTTKSFTKEMSGSSKQTT